MTHLICPLCKRELSAGTVDTRLCESCQALVQTASRPPAFAGISPSAKQQRVISQTGHEAPPNSLPFEFTDTFEDSLEPRRPFVPSYAELPESRGELVTTPLSECYSTNSDQTRKSDLLGEPFSSSTSGGDLSSGQQAGPQTGKLAFLAIDDSEAPAEPTSLANSENHHRDPQSIADEVSTDPWENALPASEYSRNEWPVLIGPPREGLLARFKTSIVVLVLLALIVGLYYLIYRQTSPQLVIDSPGPLLQSKGAETRASATPPTDSLAHSKVLASSPGATTAADLKAVPPAAHDVPTEKNEESQGQFALQAAAFPNRAAADEFAGKLKVAGVPSYVVSVGLPHRGTWFRVRVGRFNTAAEAERFAADAQLRARANGTSLELIVSSYEKP